MKKYWVTSEGRKILYKDLTDKHLLNIKRFIERKSKEGLKIYYGDSNYGFDKEPFFDIDILYGDEVLEYFDYKSIIKEIEKRRIK